MTQVVVVLALTAAVLLHAVLVDAGWFLPDVHRTVITCVRGCHVVGQGLAAAQLSVAWVWMQCGAHRANISSGFTEAWGPSGQHWLPDGMICLHCLACLWAWSQLLGPGCCWPMLLLGDAIGLSEVLP